MINIKWKIIVALVANILVCNLVAYGQSPSNRNTISLNGIWQIEEGKSDVIPNIFNHTVQVPGLVSLANPAFKEVGPKVKDRRNIAQSDTLREAFWYRHEFTVKESIPAIALLKISKAKYGTKVFLNGKDLGEHLPCFTPGYFNVKDALKTGVNELIVRVGSSRDAIPESIPDGMDFEKEHYIPGIYDDVNLILSKTPSIINIQTAPDIVNKQVVIQLNIGNSGNAETSDASFIIKEVKSQSIVGSLKEKVTLSGSGKENIITVRIPISNCHFWSPEDPFLYSLKVTTDGDEKQIQFGMREFHFDALTHQAVLNGKPYFMRGSNITVYRFFEDPLCKQLPWDSIWVRNLFKSFKKFNWNSLRFCIGLPPEEWYQIADEEGFLIQDEFPLWYGPTRSNVFINIPKEPELVVEYTEWMQESWNHPSVVIWDASNETGGINDKIDEIGKAVWQVRNLDLSNRPWDNSYAMHRAPGDVYESHPYHFSNPDFKLKDLATANVIPVGNQFKNNENYPVIINEYGWLWLNRDGSPTTLTEKLYKNLLGENSTVTERRHIYATYMAAETEFWRCNRKAAGVLIFTALGYSRSDGQTSDFFVDIEKLEYESECLKYLPDAFSPVGLMLDEWGTEIETGKAHNFNIVVINDLDKEWNGKVSLQIIKDGKEVTGKSSKFVINSFGKKTITISFVTPKKSGLYTVVALLEKKGETPVKSIREIMFK